VTCPGEDDITLIRVPIDEKAHDLFEDDDSGAIECSVCGSRDGQLLSYCPGVRLSRNAREACGNGVVVDLQRWRHRHGGACNEPPWSMLLDEL
jgi:hypothetical protein